MDTSFYKQLTVRIELLDEEGKCQSHGSGIICTHQSVYYVLTAYHCMNPMGSDGQCTPRPENWTVQLFSENGSKIAINKVLKEDDAKDIAVLKIECPDARITEDCVQLYDGMVSKENYSFRGFPEFCNYAPHTFRVSYNDDNWWIFNQQDISAGRIAGVNILAGASGSGIFFKRRDKIFIVGIALHLHDESGTLNEVYVAPISQFSTYLPATAITTFSADLLDDWEKSMNKELTVKQIEELKREQIAWIDNLVRKLSVMYPEQYQKKLDKFLEYYVKGSDFFMKQGESNSSFREALSKKTEEFFEEYQPDPKIYVDSPSDAESKFDQLRVNLVNEMGSLIPEDSNNQRVGNSYARYRLTERLLVCTLEYLKRN